jgi:carbon monoxide dehydrogenase subunit G
MTHFGTTIEIQAPPDRVWAAMSDIEHWSEWTPTIISIRPLDPGPTGVGTRAIVRQPKLLPARWQVTEVDEGRNFAWTRLGPGIQVTARHAVEGAGNSSRVTLSVDFSGPLGTLAARLIRRLNAHYLDLEVRGLKKHAEAESR